LRQHGGIYVGTACHLLSKTKATQLILSCGFRVWLEARVTNLR
jgi:hypothetical protein